MSDAPDRPSDLTRIFDEFLVRRQLGESPILDDYCQRFPDLAEQLRLHVRLYDALGEAASEADIRGSMKDLHDPRVKQILADLLSSGDTPEDVCRSCPELLPMVRAHWRQMCHVRAELDALFPPEANSDSSLPASGPGGAPLPSIPGYEVEAVLGMGGMGVVFKARHLQLNRVVALKMLIAGTYAGPPERARFQREAEAVAGLCHANIVQLYEVGEHEGRPYFAMELVDGGNLSQKLASKPQPVRRAAELVAQLAEAVSVAHSAGIIHRDLKPANILLTADGTPKITDFGLARRLKGEDRLTWTGTAIGTPSYMAPEQASGTAGPVGPAADVYGLGAVLYELLTGRPPFRGGTALETFQQVLADEPVPPSRLNPRVPRDLETVCLKCLQKEPQRRYSTASMLAEDLRRYLLGHVVLARPVNNWERAGKWFRRNPAVASLSAFAVLALVGGTVASLLFASEAGQQTGIAKDRADKLEVQTRELEAQTLAAMKNAKRAKEKEEEAIKALAAEKKARKQAFDALESLTADVVERKFAQGAVLREDDRAFLRGIIAQLQAFASITADDLDSRKMQAGGRFRVARIRSLLGEFKEAEQDYAEVVSLHKQLVADFPSRPEFCQRLAACYNQRGLLLCDTGRLEEAAKDYDQALSIQKQLATDFPSVLEFRRDLASHHLNRGNLLRDTGRLEEAAKDYDQALSIQKQLATDFPSRHELRRELAASHLNLGALLRDTGRLKEAEKEYGLALSIQKQLAADFPSRPEFRQDLAKSYNNRGYLLNTVGRLPEAEKDYDKTVSLCKLLAAEFPSVPEFRRDLASSHLNRGNLLDATGRHQEAEKDYDQALSIQKQLAADFPSRPEFRQDLAKSHSNRGLLLRDLGRLKDAEQDYNQSLNIRRQLTTDFPSRPEFREDLASSHLNRGTLLSDTGRLEEAEKDYDQALSIQKQLVDDFPSRPEFRRELAASHVNRGTLLRDTGRLKEAAKEYDQALSIQRQLTADFPLRPEFRQDLAKCHLNQGNLLYALGRLKEAENDYDQAVGLYKQLAADFPSVTEYRHELASCHCNRGVLLRDTGRLLQAEKDYDQALNIQKQLVAESPSRPEFRHGLATSHNNRARLLYARDRQPEAMKDYDQAVSLYKQLAADFPSRPDFRRDLAISHNGRGVLLSDMGRLPEAEKDYEEALRIQKQMAADFPSQHEFLKKLARSHNSRGLLLKNMDRFQEAEKEYDQAVRIQKQLVADFPNQPEILEDLARSYNNRGIVLDKTGRRQEAVKDYELSLSIKKQLADESSNKPDRRNELAATYVNLAYLHLQLGNWAAAKQLLLEGKPHHLAALKANPLHPTYRRFYRNNLNVLIASHAGLLEQPEALSAAETCRNLGWKASEDAYSAACGLSLSVTAVAKHDKLDTKQREEAVQLYSDAAMKALRVAVSNGYKDVTNIKTDTDLDPLRQREDFKKLVAELEGKGK